MKIAHIVSTFPPYQGGMGNSVYGFADALANLGHEVIVFTAKTKEKIDDDESKLKKIKFKVVYLSPLIKFGNSAVLPQIFTRLRNFDIVHLHYPFYGTAELALAKKIISGKKLKLVLHYHMDNYGTGIKGLIFKTYQKLILPLLLKYSELITCASLDYIEHSFIKNYYRQNKNKFKETYFGVDLNKFKVIANTKKPDPKTILFIGKLDYTYISKGLGLLFKAVNILMAKYNVELELNIIASGNRVDYFKKIAKNLKIMPFVNFLGKVGDQALIENYNKSDVFVLSADSRGEAFGIVLLEAMACACPVIAPNLPGVRSVFNDGEQGYYFINNNANNLAEKIYSVLKDSVKAEEMRRKGKELAIKKYDINKIGKNLSDIYKEII